MNLRAEMMLMPFWFKNKMIHSLSQATRNHGMITLKENKQSADV